MICQEPEDTQAATPASITDLSVTEEAPSVTAVKTTVHDGPSQNGDPDVEMAIEENATKLTIGM